MTPFVEEKFDDGEKTFLGRTGRWDAPDIVRIALDDPAAATFLCRKLYRFFIADVEAPPEELVNDLARELRESNYSIAQVVGVILRSEHFFSSAAYRQKIASPVEVSAGVVRTLSLPQTNTRLFPLADAIRRQGQHLFFPPNVSGWKGGRHWITSLNVLHRGNWLTDLVWGNPRIAWPPFDPVEWLEANHIARGDAVEALIDLLVQGDASPEVVKVVRRTAALGDVDSLRKAVQLILHCPEFQLV